MKKTRKTMIAVLLAMSLVGCSTQEPLPEVEAIHPEVTALQVTEAPDEVLTTVPVELSPASEETVPELQETVPAVKAEEREQEKPTPKPQPTEPKETAPLETKPAETKPQPTDPVATEPPATEGSTTEPPVTEPPTTEPAPTETVPEEPEPTEVPAEVIDTAALEAYGRSYASSTYGYNGTSACHPGTGAGYFPAATKKITSMEEGYSIVRQAIDSQYKRDCAYGYTPYEEIDGKIVRCPINVSVSSTGEPNVYSITVYYGGTA
ncbi:MAG: hypothetical protein IIW56_02450 [Oscillospiraceae bacterium]|nr:hypothetical protein [Oscillospiraceae bacterium]